MNTEKLYNATHGPFYTDINGKTWSYLSVVSGSHMADGYNLKDRLIPDDKKKFEDEYDKNLGEKCPTCGRR